MFYSIIEKKGVQTVLCSGLIFNASVPVICTETNN